MSGKDVIEVVRGRIDIVDLVGSYLPLKRTGANFKALCPFHDEKSPSFTVSPTRQTFHCFGCGERGGVFDFVMRHERIEFRDALEVLASRAGVALEDYEKDDGGAAAARRSKKARLLELHGWARRFFREHYLQDAGQTARAYVEQRGIALETAEHFQLGAAPDSWTALVDGARRQGFAEADLEAAGLALPGTRRPGLYDRFRGRLMFPIRDAMGRDIAFGARTLDGSEPKYLNSPETELFHKGHTVFAVDDLKGHAREEPILVMEGYTDVLMSWQHGVRGAVATLGTALTPEHARLLRRYGEHVVLVYDGDPAGLKAAERGAQQLLEAGNVDLQVIVLPERMDPCDFFVQHGAAGVEELLQLRRPLLDFLLERASSRHDLSELHGRREAALSLIGTAAAIDDRMTRELVIERIGESLRLSRTVLDETVARERDRRLARGGGGRATTSGPAQERTPHEGTSFAGESREALNLKRRVQRDLAEAWLNEPSLLERFDPQASFSLLEPPVVALLTELAARFRSGVTAPGALVDHLADGKLRGMASRLLLPEDHGRALAAQLEGALTRLEMISIESRVQEAKSREEGEDLAEIQRLMRERKGRKSESGS